MATKAEPLNSRFEETFGRRAEVLYVAPGRVHGQVNDGDQPLRILCSLAPPPVAAGCIPVGARGGVKLQAPQPLPRRQL